jgi:hypothetical protein
LTGWVQSEGRSGVVHGEGDDRSSGGRPVATMARHKVRTDEHDEMKQGTINAFGSEA